MRCRLNFAKIQQRLRLYIANFNSLYQRAFRSETPQPSDCCPSIVAGFEKKKKEEKKEHTITRLSLNTNSLIFDCFLSCSQNQTAMHTPPMSEFYPLTRILVILAFRAWWRRVICEACVRQKQDEHVR